MFVFFLSSSSAEFSSQKMAALRPSSPAATPPRRQVYHRLSSTRLTQTRIKESNSDESIISTGGKGTSTARSPNWLILLTQSLAYSYSLHSFSAQNTILFTLPAILTLQSLLLSSLTTDQTQPIPSKTTLVGSAILVLLDHLFLLCSTNNLSALSLILITTCSSQWSPSISQLLTKPWLSSSQHSADLTPSALVGLCMLVTCFTIDHYMGPQPDSTSLMMGYLFLSAHLVCRGFHLTNQQNDQSSGHPKSVAFTATALSLILGLAGLLLPSAASAPGHWGAWGVAVMMYAIIDHLSLTEASKSARDSGPGSDDILSFIIIRMLSCELAGTLAFDHPMGNMSDRLVGMVSYLGISSIAPSSDAFKTTAAPPRQLNPFLKMSRFIQRARSVINTILLNPESRNIYFFLCLNLAFMLIQMTYGIWTNSLGLISDSIHMFFDCMALGMGLFASVMATWPADKQFTYGYGRVETLSGFANGVFLMLISTFIVFEAVQRLIDPPEMNTNQLLTVSFIGLMVNLVGMFATGHHHHHHGHSHDHDHDHGHSHNMKGVFLHVMADTLGSVGVIISTLLIERYGWTGFDPIASIFIAVLIFASVVPLVQDSAKILMLCLDDEREKQVRKALGKLSTIEGLSSYSAPRFWPQDSSSIAGSLHLQISPIASQSELTTSSSLGSPVMMLEEQEELFACYGHAELVKKRVEQSLATNIPGLTELTIQVEGIDGSKNCFCLTGPNC